MTITAIYPLIVTAKKYDIEPHANCQNHRYGGGGFAMSI